MSYIPDRRFDESDLGLGPGVDAHRVAADHMSITTELFPIFASPQYHEAVIASMEQAVRENMEMEADYAALENIASIDNLEAATEDLNFNNEYESYWEKITYDHDQTRSTDNATDYFGESSKGYIEDDSRADAYAKGSGNLVQQRLEEKNVDPNAAPIYVDPRNSVYTNVQATMMRVYELSADKILEERRETEEFKKLEITQKEFDSALALRQLQDPETGELLVPQEEIEEAFKEAFKEVVLDDPEVRNQFKEYLLMNKDLEVSSSEPIGELDLDLLPGKDDIEDDLDKLFKDELDELNM